MFNISIYNRNYGLHLVRRYYVEYLGHIFGYVINGLLFTNVGHNFMLFWCQLWTTHSKYMRKCRSDESSWRSSSELLVEIARHGEDNGFEVPCLIVSAKDEQNSFPTATQELTGVYT